jgi:hypothetical protein
MLVFEEISVPSLPIGPYGIKKPSLGNQTMVLKNPAHKPASQPINALRQVIRIQCRQTPEQTGAVPIKPSLELCLQLLLPSSMPFSFRTKNSPAEMALNTMFTGAIHLWF